MYSCKTSVAVKGHYCALTVYAILHVLPTD